MKRFFTKRVLLWPIFIVTTCFVAVGVVGAVGVVSGMGPMRALSNIFAFESKSETRNTQVINSITREEQVVLLSLGIQGIQEKNEQNASFLGVEVPGSDRASFIQYSFTGKLGIDGKDVRIEQTGENQFLVSIPDYVFIGHDNESFRLVSEKNGALSWMTPPIDAVEMINDILNDDAKDQYIDSNEAVLKDQTMVFYEGIIGSIDSTVDVEFEFLN